MNTQSKRWAKILATTLILAACGGAAEDGTGDSGDDATCDDYPSRDIRMVIPYSTGGGFDTWGRLVAQHMPAHLPNEVQIVPENREGGGGVIGATEVLNADADGYTIGIGEPGGLSTAQIGGEADIDVTELTAIGRVLVSPEVIVVADDHPWQSIEDAQAEEGTVLLAAGGYEAVVIVPFDALGIDWELIAHEGSSESVLSLLRGDTDVSVFSLNSQLENLRNGDLRPLAVIGTKPVEGEDGFEELEGVPTLDDATGIDGIGTALEQHRLIFSTPGIPDCVRDVLEAALQDTLADAEMLTALEEAGQLPPKPANAEETQAILANTLAQLTEYADLLEETVE